MENEGELTKEAAKHADSGFSEKIIDLKVDLAVKSKYTAQSGQIFIPQKKAQTVFQAQKEEEK
jgi:hypothetical protein